MDLVSIFYPAVFYRYDDTPISYCSDTVAYTPCIHTRMLFFTFLHLALCSRNNKPPHRYTEPSDQPSAPSLAIIICTSSVGLRPYDCWTVGLRHVS